MSRTDAAILRDWTARLVIRRGLLAAAERELRHAERGLTWAQTHRRPSAYPRSAKVAELRIKVAARRAQVAEATAVVARHKVLPLRERAYNLAVHQVGVVESGGNNSGVPLARYIRANGGSGPEPWCGDFMAWCYRHAGSKSVLRAWAAVRLLLPLTGLSRTTRPQRGDLVRFDFSASGLDHVGMFVRDLGNGTIETIEGNTGTDGARSDGSSGDGVHRRVRSKSLVHDYIRVTR